jgi:hypothetical protein
MRKILFVMMAMAVIMTAKEEVTDAKFEEVYSNNEVVEEVVENEGCTVKSNHLNVNGMDIYGIGEDMFLVKTGSDFKQMSRYELTNLLQMH